MANFRADNGAIDDIANRLKHLSADLQGELQERLLDAGGEVAVEEWQKAIQRHGHVDTGEMLRSVKKKQKGSVAEIYPQGKDNKKVRNADKAYILHYGTSKNGGSHFVDEAEAEIDVKSPERMQAIFDQYLREKGLI